MNKIIKNLSIALIGFLLAISVLILSILWSFSNNLPDYKFLKSYKPSVSSKVFSGNGDLVADFSQEKRIFVPYNSIPQNVINSFLSAEDKNFFSHPGVDAKGVLRAIINNISNIISSKRLEGASTITQQVAKNFLLTNEVSINRKIKEAILAFRIERALTKERILELYLNQIYLGSGAYGVAAASLEYFDKSIKELNYAESALLAALPKAPSRYNPYRDKDLAKFRRDLIVQNLYDNNFIDKNEYEQIIKEEIKLKKSEKIYLEDAQYYIEDVRKDIIEKLSYDKVYKEGLNINTPINLNLQRIATESLRDGLIDYDKRRGWRGALKNIKYSENWFDKFKEYQLEKTLGWEVAIVKKISKFSATIETENKENGSIKFDDISWTKKEFKDLFEIGDVIYVKNINDNIFSLKQLPRVNGGIVVMDPYTGRVLALSGGFSFKKSEFNRATQALRQPGSAFKPFIYALALENDYTPTSLILDAPLVLEQGEDLKMWKPENYGKKFYGPSTLRVGLEKSRNLMTVRIAQNLGIEKVVNFSKNLGIYDNPEKLLSISLGSAETTLMKLTTAYSSFVNGGKLVTPVIIDRIQDSEGKTIFSDEMRKCTNCEQISFSSNSYPKIKDNYKQVFSPQTAYQMTSILEGVVQRGTGKQLKDLNLNLAGKTGTTNENTDTWFIGFTSNLVVGVYVGEDDPKPLGKFETGARTALPIFKEFVSEAIKKSEARPFKAAEGTIMMVVDSDTGQKAKFSSKNTIVEVYKEKNVVDGKVLYSNNNRLDTNNILKFY
ncbi:MAG: penicillin-binding protein [Pelagibacteraceae bacterium BACL5 MAG-120705-bin12]|jgi:penicillin-binding protein 1A|uniref:penicillin-binding protein 1A n=1 Tax=Candidatus Pelagibacter sp. TaxID=2024849 RepID=UPI000714886A|nr:MAG: penicillin-binding protein [Pelagibacteraceae bacterium BACL5 MAG-121015-bin10]KRO61054.1 MAG: penicillin-binding protein [Pelagibacteraceae bacterium BACL5 MAG-120705-bin12]KRO65303.1 MAG: penicillin-binding protein [Pelagibacteraceae bacterium BACL5 MAG-120820-bin39]